MRVYAHILQPTYENICFIFTELVIKEGYFPFDTITVVTVYSFMQITCFGVFFPGHH